MDSIENGDICSIPMIVCQRVDIFIQSPDISPAPSLAAQDTLPKTSPAARQYLPFWCTMSSQKKAPKIKPKWSFCGNLDRTWFLIVSADCFYSG